jgi:hypothetical protein
MNRSGNNPLIADQSRFTIRLENTLKSGSFAADGTGRHLSARVSGENGWGARIRT